MATDKLRKQIAYEAARLIYLRQEEQYYRAKLRAGRRVARGWVKPADLPSNAEIRDEIQALSRLHERNGREQSLRDLRVEALRMMRLLWRFRPRLIGSTLSGHVRDDSSIGIDVFSDSIADVTDTLDAEELSYEVDQKPIEENGPTSTCPHVLVEDRFEFDLTVYPASAANRVTHSSDTAAPTEPATIGELEELLSEAHAQIPPDAATEQVEARPDRFEVYESLLLPLEHVKQSRKWHPEGDALYHSLQVFDLARDERPYDEEFLLAALLHDVGKVIDRKEHVAAGLEAMEGFITPRTAWLIEHHAEATAHRDGTLGARSRRRLEQSEDFEELMLLADCDRRGREPGARAPELDEALDYVRQLAETCGE